MKTTDKVTHLSPALFKAKASFLCVLINSLVAP